MNPLVIITSETYNNEECYKITTYNSGKNIENVQKETSILLYTKRSTGVEEFYEYNFDINQEMDLEKPNTENYTFVESN